MPLDETALISGPRGRRFLYAVAIEDVTADTASIDLAQALFRDAVDYINSTNDRGGVAYIREVTDDSDDADESDAPVEPAPRENPSIEQLAAALKEVTLPEVTALTAFSALETAVDSAIYWEEPDGPDEILTRPALRPGLSRIAAHALASPEVAWWDAPMASEQWAVTFTDSTHPPAPDWTAAETFQRWKTEGGFDWGWWSIPPGALTSTTQRPEGLWPLGLSMIEDTFGWEKAYADRLVIPPTARIFEITGADAWAWLCRTYPLVTSGSAREWRDTTGRNGKWMIPDWSLVARDFDAVHLTVSAYLCSAGTAIAINDEFASVIAGWHPDQTFWLTDVLTDETTRVSWACNHEDRGWHRD